MNDYITIPLNKTGKHAGLYEAKISPKDEILTGFNWGFQKRKNRETVYARGRYKGQKQLLHRVVLSRMLERPLLDSEFVDHIDGDGLNCTRGNLRLATRSENGKNRGKQSNNTSGVTGVSWNKSARKWHAKIHFQQKWIHLGLFEKLEDAEIAYKAKSNELFGKFLKH